MACATNISAASNTITLIFQGCIQDFSKGFPDVVVAMHIVVIQIATYIQILQLKLKILYFKLASLAFTLFLYLQSVMDTMSY